MPKWINRLTERNESLLSPLVRFSQRLWNNHEASTKPRRVAILGAGEAGVDLADQLLHRNGVPMKPIAFFDDDPAKWQSRVHGLPVVGGPDRLLDPERRRAFDEVVLAMPEAPPSRRRELVHLLKETGLRIQTVPAADPLGVKREQVGRTRPVEIEDLLGGGPISVEVARIRRMIEGKVVMVTGAGGSIGSELCRQISALGPRTLVLVEQSEVQLFSIEQELTNAGALDIEPCIADVLDTLRMERLLHWHRPEVIFHAAAHKHVPLMERQPSQAIRNNTMATLQLAELAIDAQVDRFVFVSSDKAINPTSVMGVSKLLAEVYLQAVTEETRCATKFMSVRFGNVLGSSGSVLPIFRQQIAAGGPVRVTDPDASRYFMTLWEAVGLVLQSGAQGKGGEILVLDMGEPVRILDLARELIELKGLRPDQDIAIELTGLRPGEKRCEELHRIGDQLSPTDHPQIRSLISDRYVLGKLRDQLFKLDESLHEMSSADIKRQVQQIIPEYTPYE